MNRKNLKICAGAAIILGIAIFVTDMLINTPGNAEMEAHRRADEADRQANAALDDAQLHIANRETVQNKIIESKTHSIDGQTYREREKSEALEREIRRPLMEKAVGILIMLSIAIFIFLFITRPQIA